MIWYIHIYMIYMIHVHDSTELCEFIGIYIQSLLESTLGKDLMGLYRDDELIILCNTNS